MPFGTLQQPGLYPGAGQARLLNAGRQAFLLQSQRVTANQASIAVELERQKSGYYPWGAALQVNFSGAPGVFELDIEAAETDTDAAFISIVTIVAVNANNYGRASIGFTWPKYVRGKIITLTNDVLTTLIITR